MKASNSLLYLLAAALIGMLIAGVTMRGTTVSYSEFLSQASTTGVQSVVVKNDNRTLVYYSNGKKFVTVLPFNSSEIIPILTEKKIPVTAESPPNPLANAVGQSLFVGFIITSFLLLGLWLLGRGKKGMLGKSQNKFEVVDPDKIETTLDDIAGHPHEINEVRELVDFIVNAEQYKAQNVKVPSGILMVGPPGVGKTLLAKAMAKESGIKFISVAGSEFDEMYVGVGASRVRELFTAAKKNAPCIVFIDEIDCLVPQRSSKRTSGSDQTLNQILHEMDGMLGSSGVTVVGATNRHDMMDEAILRPGRFDRIVPLSLPDMEIRKQILQIHTAKKQLADDVDLEIIAKGTPGFSGAELMKLCNEAAIYSVRERVQYVTMEHFEKAKDKVVMGESSSKKYDQKELLLTAYHEAGHAIVGALSPEHDPLHKVTIIPRANALGVTFFLPEEKGSISFTGLKSKILTLMAGRAAEEIVYGKDAVTTGASNDIQVASRIARRMFEEWGYGSWGPVYSGDNCMTPSMKALVDREIADFLKDAYNEALILLEKHKPSLDKVANLLLDKETIDATAVTDVLKESGE